MPARGDAPRLGPFEALVLETYGLPLLAYLCATDEQAVRDRLEGLASLSPGAESTLTGELVPLAQDVASRLAAQPGLPRSFSLDILGRPMTDGGTSIGNALHLASGGDIPSELLSRDPDDSVKSVLTRMAIDSYPLLLAPANLHSRMPRFSLYQHPQREELQAAVQSDAVLGRLFPEDDPGLGRRGYLYTSLGRGGSIQDVMFGEMIIVSAWDMAFMASPNPTRAQLVEQVNANVDTLRAALTGSESTVRALVVFTGFTTHDDRPISTPWGPLRRLYDWERELAPADLEGSVSGTSQDGNQVTVSYAGEMVLETELPYNVVVSRMSEAVELPLKWPTIKGADALRRRLEGVQLAVLLATDPPIGSWVTAKLAWCWTGDPFGHGSNIGWSDVRSSPGFMPYEVSVEESEAIEEWARLVESRWSPDIDIAVRRFLSAANARTDMTDRLVDAVIVWENLFGTRQGEPTLRISSALAWLLSDDAIARAALQKELKDTYEYRSTIVHGGKPDETSLGEQANSALAHARDALRALFHDRPDVLALRGGAARSLRMILGG